MAVNGGADTSNPGTTCVRLSNPPAVCTGGYIGIPNNNKMLVVAALTSKANGSRVWVYLSDGQGTQHCPGRVFTPCSAISIEAQ